MQEEYFKFNLYGDKCGDIEQTGKYVFQNIDGVVSVNSALPFLVLHYVTNYNLADLEFFFRLAGFSAFTEEELPNSIVTPVAINLTNRNNVTSGWYGGFNKEEEAKKFIESRLGEGIISRFQDIKRKKLLHERDSLLEKLANIDSNELIQSLTCDCNILALKKTNLKND